MPLVNATVRHWLVEHPLISSFEWIPGRTFGASPEFLAAVVLSYLSLTLILRRLLPASSLVSPFLFRSVSALHNLILLLLSAVMAAGCSLSASAVLPTLRHLFCLPNPTPSTGPLFFWAYVFYLSKLLEFVDTLLILVNPSGKRRLTFLHVYHHASVVVMCYLWLAAAQSLFPVALVTNASVHTVMYGYYFLCSVGRPPRWKRVVTDVQIVQFVFSFAVSIMLLWYEFADREGGGCSGIKAWLFNAGFNGSLLALFVNFHLKSYGSSKKEREKAT
ncbi:fatty acid elongase 3-like [Aristolochia californica]|uniref:fatty acid elongase 3-like n=1 Tax=Aristolochia californica TaxID=171875 RepID=UPI0035D91156